MIIFSQIPFRLRRDLGVAAGVLVKRRMSALTFSVDATHLAKVGRKAGRAPARSSGAEPGAPQGAQLTSSSRRLEADPV